MRAQWSHGCGQEPERVSALAMAYARDRWWGAWGFAMFALVLSAACSELKQRAAGAKVTPVDLEGLWVGQGFACGDVQMSVRQQQRLLAASSAAESKCAPIGALLWQGELPKEVVRSSDLPLTIPVELALPTMRTAAVTVISVDHMVLLVDETTVKLQRGTRERPPMVDEMGGRGAVPEDKAQPTASSSSSGAMAAAPEPAGADGAAGKAAAADSSGAGAAASISGGAGGAISAAGSGVPVAGAAGMGAPPAAGGGAGAGSGAGSGAAGALPPGKVPQPDLGGRSWFCINSLGTCACVLNNSPSTSAVNCTAKYPCCYTDIKDDEPNCICNARVSGSCVDFDDDPDYRPVDWCPGESRQ